MINRLFGIRTHKGCISFAKQHFIRSVGTGCARRSTWIEPYGAQRQESGVGTYQRVEIIVWKNMCFVRTTCHGLDTGYQWLYQTNSFIILLVRQSVFKFECLFARAPRGQRFEKPRNKAVPCLVLYFFDNGSLAKKGGLKTKRRMTLPEYVQPWQWESMTRNRKTYRLKPNQYNNPPKESIETDCKQHGCRGSSIWITAAMR